MKFGISPAGCVGPQTLAVLNTQGNVVTSSGTPNNSIAPFISCINVTQNGNMATVSWSTNEPTQGKIYYDSKPLYTYERENSVSAQTTYHFLIYVTDQDGNVSVAWPLTFRTN